MVDQEDYTPEQIIKAIEKAKGNVSAAARALKCNRKTVTNYAARYPAVQEALDEMRERRVDDAEDQLGKQVKEGNMWAITFTLKTLGKSRGYVERQEITGADGQPINIQVNWTTPEKPLGLSGDDDE